MQTNLSFFYGSTKKSFKITGVTINGSASKTGVTLNYPTTAGTALTFKATYATNATISGKDDIAITLQPVDATSETRVLHFTINGVRPGNNGEPATEPSGNVTCSVTKSTGNGAPQTITTGFTLNTYLNGSSTAYGSSTVPASSVTSKIVYELLVSGVIVDRETIPLVTDGTDGTSINVKGKLVAVVLASAELPTTGISIGDLGIKQGSSQVYIYQQVTYTTAAWIPYATADDGHSFTMTKDCTIDLEGDGTSVNINGHLIMWSSEANKWVDLGQFKGDSGITYYTHIAWASDVTEGTTPSGHTTTGQTTTPNATAVTGFSVAPFDGAAWMGVLVNTLRSDSTDPLAYTWNESKGADGKYKLSAYKTSVATPTKPTGTSVAGEVLENQGWYLSPSQAAARGREAATLTYTMTSSSWTRSGNKFISPATTEHNGYYHARIAFTTTNSNTVINLRLTSSSESYDFGYIGKLDTDLSSTVGSNYIARAAGNGTVVNCILQVPTAGSHYFDIVYKKDSSVSSYNDNAIVEIFIASQIWEVQTWVEKDASGTEYAVGWSDPVEWNGIGQEGHTGRFYYYAGEYDLTPGHYFMGETQAPYVKYGVDENGKPQFWMLDFKGEEPVNFPAHATDAPSDNSVSWTKMAAEQQYYIAKAFFGDYAQFGSFIINGDWMISTEGTVTLKKNYIVTAVNDNYSYGQMVNLTAKSTGQHVIAITAGSINGNVTVRLYRNQSSTHTVIQSVTLNASNPTGTITADLTAGESYTLCVFKASSSVSATISLVSMTTASGYLYFVGTDPTGQNEQHFAPNYAVDGKTGKTYQNDAYIKGEIHATSGSFVGSITANGSFIAKDSNDANVVIINGSDSSASSSDTGVTILDAAGLYSRKTNDGFRLTGSTMQRYHRRKGWVSMFAARCVEVLGSATATGQQYFTLDEDNDFVLIQNIKNHANVTLPSPSSVTPGKIYTIVAMGGSGRNIYLSISGGGYFQAGDIRTQTLTMTNYEQANFVAYGSYWFATNAAW